MEYKKGKDYDTSKLWLLLARELLKKISDEDAKTCVQIECVECAKVDCPHNEPLHWHHDGCPACNPNSEIKKSHFFQSEPNKVKDIESSASVASEDESKLLGKNNLESCQESSASVQPILFVAIGNDEISDETKTHIGELFGSGNNDDGLKAISLLLTGEETLPRHCNIHNKDFFLKVNASFPCCKSDNSASVQPLYFLHDIKVREFKLEELPRIAKWLEKCPIKLEHYRLPIYKDSASVSPKGGRGERCET